MKFIFTVFLFSTLLFFSCTEIETPKLPILGQQEIVRIPFDNYKIGDTLFHELPYFELYNQNGDTLTTENLKGKIHIANFFFASCPQVCPLMMKNINTFKQKWQDKIQFISYSVDPEKDTPAQLQLFAQKNELNLTNWDLMTGDKNEIYNLAQSQGYLLNVGEDIQAEGGFFHSTQVVLVDQKLRIRGIFDSTEKELKELDKALQILINEK